MRLTAKQATWLKVCLHLAGLLPFLWLVWAINHGGLGADPVKDIQHFTGRTALKFLLAALLITPLARYAKQPLLIRTRRLLGLWCFAWATLHLTSYALLELGVNNLALLGKELITRPYLTLGIISWVILLALAFTSTQSMQRKLGKHCYALLELGVNNLALLGKELITRPYLTLGIISWVILLALAFTSTQSMQRKLGKHWQQLHNFVYLVAILAPIHYLWSVKILSPQPLIYAGLAVLLLALRYNKLLSLFNRLRKQVHNKLSL